MKKIGITGGIGAGKSTVSKVFKLLGVPIYNSDQISKKILLKNHTVQKEIVSVLGDDILIKNKSIDVFSIDTKKVSKIIFNDKEKLYAVNKILHNRVKLDFNNWIVKQKGDYIMKESAIIFESKIESTFDKIIFVKSTKEARIKRIKKRDKKETKDILSIMESQYSNEFLSKKADFIINNETNKLLIPQIIELHEKIKYS